MLGNMHLMINIGIIKNIKDKERINLFKNIKQYGYYWLPIEKEESDFKRMLAYLKTCGVYNSERKISKDNIRYTLFNLTESLPLFPYTTKKNGGDGLIHYKMLIDKIIYSPDKNLKIINEQLEYDSIYKEAGIWLRIIKNEKLGIRGYRLEDEFKPFLSEEKMDARRKFYINFQFDKDYLKLSNYLIVQNYNHNSKRENCGCLMCRQ